MAEDGVKARAGIANLVKKLDKHCAHRKTRRRDIRLALEKEVMKTMKADADRRQEIIDLDAPEAGPSAAGDDEESDNEDLSQAAMFARDDEPGSWRDVPEDHTIVVPGDEETEHDEDVRRDFINQWIDLVCSI
jgi:hypothetical protein